MINYTKRLVSILLGAYLGLFLGGCIVGFIFFNFDIMFFMLTNILVFRVLFIVSIIGAFCTMLKDN